MIASNTAMIRTTAVSQFARNAVITITLIVMSTLPGASQKPSGTTGHAATSLTVAISLPDAITNGVAIAPDGRTFVVIAKQKGQNVPQLAEYVGGQLKPYPNESWNEWKTGADASLAWVHANSVRLGPDGTLWVVDFGSPGLGESIVKHGPKLVEIEIATGKVVETLYMDSLSHPESALDDVRFNGNHAYLTDAGWPGLIVVHLPDGAMYRALTDTDSVKAQKPLRAQGHELQDKHGKPIYFHADQLEVSPDGKLVYYQPCSGPMSVIESSYLDDPKITDEERAHHVRLFVNNGTAGGTAIDRSGNIYVSDTDHSAVLKVTPAGKVSTLVQDPRLNWVDAMWITPDGRLWMPAAQMNHTPSFNDGKMDVHYPMQVFTVRIGDGPPERDHR
jgi:sugar lactone lactonase YvrE